MLDKMPTTSSALSAGGKKRVALTFDFSDWVVDSPSANDAGLVVKIAVSSRRKRS